ncbi:outward-rectifier potassium channel tok1 [Fusarium longipes]|uniref:Outward-rectifier potassium channel tok1 n=1 Tax=Fusarium longipes TaxID=694270 RepID=A0A395RIF5_9HYPO|nr:outward-rectifier potassium channel tok1 [Fusarium longipes]
MLLLTSSQRTLMLQSIMLLLYLLLGAYVFSNIESWQYLDAVYWAVVTLFTVGFGDYYPDTELGRGLLIPFALAGIISLGLVINSVRNLIFEEGSRCVTVRIGNKKRKKTVNKILLNSGNLTLEPIQDDIRRSSTGPDTSKTEFDRRKAEFNLMRRIQAEASTRRRWVAMGTSTFSWLVLWLLGALVFQKAEHTYQGWSYFDALYFCFEAWTTIGYGDLSPVSNAGRSFYVFWSLLALPTMTVLISNASNTVVRVIRDITVLVGNITILPNDRPFLRNVKGLVHKITFGKLFSDLASEPSRSTACGNGARKQSIENLQQSSNEYRSRLASTSVPRVPILPLTGPLHANFPSLSTPDLSKRAQELTTAVDFQLLLTSEIRTVTGHLQEPQPHHYTFDEWVWYLKLLGEDEHSSKTHCRVETGHSQSQSSEDGYNGSAKWSWIGDQSPLLSCQLESEWILTRLIEKMRESLLLSKRVQVEDYRHLSYQRGQEKL